MTCKQAKILEDDDVKRLLSLIQANRYPARDVVMILLSTKAGLRAGEIAQLTWPMVLDAKGEIGRVIELRNHAAKKGSGRTIPIHPVLSSALKLWLESCRLDNGRGVKIPELEGHVITSERAYSLSGSGMRPGSVVNWFAQTYQKAGLVGCSSHSGRRTFVTKAAKVVHRAGGSLRDVQQLAGHRSIAMTQRYIDGDTEAQHKLISLL